MSFHGDITNISPTFFQFDKTFANRYVMELNMTTDNIYPGRFVLVKYDNDQAASDYVSAYPIPYEDNYIFTTSNSDTTGDYPGSKSPIKLVEFKEDTTIVNKDNVTNFYLKRANRYVRVPNKAYYDNTEKYYGAYVNNEFTTETNICMLNEVIQARDVESGELLQQWYRCIGSGNAYSLNNIAYWELLAEEDVRTYNRNFWVDINFYGTESDFDPMNRGYDSTVWQKVYSEKGERYELVARLNALMPAMELIADPPSETPLAPHLDLKSTDTLYQIHVPTPWGFRIKPCAAPNEQNPTVKSDANATYTYTQLDEHFNRVQSEPIKYAADLYYNKNGFNIEVSNKENEMVDNISFTPSGTNRFFYLDEDGNSQVKTVSLNYPHSQIDTMELSIHLPTIGNAIAKFYDMVYDVNTQNNNKRYRDVRWYNASSPARTIGDSSLGFKTYNLNTVAGTLNTFHNKLGQIIEEIPFIPDDESTIKSYSNDFIYHIEDSQNYYRRANDYNYEELTDADYVYESIDLNESEWQPGVYYIKDGNNYLPDRNRPGYPTNGDNGFSPTESYYIRKINTNRVQAYQQIDDLMDFNPKTEENPEGQDYWYMNGVDYIYEKNPSTPTVPENTYYNVILGTPKVLRYGYKPNTFYWKDGNGNYRIATEEIPDLTKDYLAINTAFYQNNSWYVPGKYYYFADANPSEKTQPVLDTSPIKVTHDGGLWYLNFGETPHYSYNIQTGQISQVFLVENMIDVTNSLFDICQIGTLDASNDYQYLYKKDELGNLIKVSDFKYTLVENKQASEMSKYFIKVDDEYIYQGEETFNPTYNYYTRTMISDELSPSPSKGVPKGDYYIIHDISRVNDEMYIVNKFYTYNEDTKDICLSALNWDNNGASQGEYYTIEDIQATAYPNPFYIPNKYFYKEGSFYFLDDSQSKVSGRTYYSLAKICILDDLFLECPYGFEWNNELEIVPWRFDLGLRKDIVTLAPIQGFESNNWSINGVLLKLAKMLELNNPRTRDTSTVQGVINKAADMIYTINGTLTPHKMLYVNEFGRITSSPIEHLPFYNLMTYELDDTTDNDEVYSEIHQDSGIVSIEKRKAGNLVLTGYSEAAAAANIAATDTINTAFGKTQKNISSLQNEVNILNGDDSTSGSVAKQIKDAIAGVVNNAPPAFDTLKELADWIEDDNTGAAAIVSEVNKLKTKTTLGTYETVTYELAEGTYEEGVTYYTSSTGEEIVDTTGFEDGVTDVSEYYIEKREEQEYDTTENYVSSLINNIHVFENEETLDGITSEVWTNLNNKLTLGTYETTSYELAEGTYVSGVDYYEDDEGLIQVDTTDFEEGVTDVSLYYIQVNETQEYQSVYEYVHTLENQIEALEARILALENPTP